MVAIILHIRLYGSLFVRLLRTLFLETADRRYNLHDPLFLLYGRVCVLVLPAYRSDWLLCNPYLHPQNIRECKGRLKV